MSNLVKFSQFLFNGDFNVVDLRSDLKLFARGELPWLVILEGFIVSIYSIETMLTAKTGRRKTETYQSWLGRGT